MLLTWLTVDQCCKYVTSGLAGEFVGGVQEDISVLDEIEEMLTTSPESLLGDNHWREMLHRNGE